MAFAIVFFLNAAANFVLGVILSDYARLSLSLAPGFLAFCSLYSMCDPVFQLERKTWPFTLAALTALAANLALIRLPFFSQDIEGLA
jgi:O-antigen/teichoic acid export membrane protein